MSSSRRAAATGAEDGVAPEGASPAVDPAFHRAILKIAIELRKPNPGSYDAVVEETARRLGLDAVGFRRYLGGNGERKASLLLAAAQRLGPPAPSRAGAAGRTWAPIRRRGVGGGRQVAGGRPWQVRGGASPCAR